MKRASVPLVRYGMTWVLAFLVSACAFWSKSGAPLTPPEGGPEGSMAPKPTLAEPPPPPQVEAPPPAPPLPLKPPAAQPPRAEAPKAPAPPTPPQPPPKLVSLHFEGADLELVLRTLAEIAGINFVLAQGVKVQVTMRIDRLPATEAFSIMQAILEANNLAAIKAGPVYKIVPAAAAAQQPTPIGIGTDETISIGEGFLTQIVPLQYLSAEELVKVLQPLLMPGKVLAYREANSLILSGPASMIKRLLQTIQTLDVPGKQREAQQVYVYYVENAKAKELADVLMSLFGERRPERPAAPARPEAPRPPQPPRPGVPTPPPPTPAPPSPEAARMVGEVRVVADERTNALIIKATPQDYELIEATIKKLDITPKQVVIEVLAAEISLTDQLSFGLEQLLRAGEFAFQQFFGLGPVPEQLLRGVATNIPGFTMTFVDPDRFRLFLNTLAVFTKINTLATPHILTQDNKEARIQVGREVPIITGTQSTITAVAQQGQNVFQTLQQRDVGRILTIKPHVNEKRQVTLDVQLEVSDIESLTTGAIGSPTFSKRTAQTSVVVEDGQSLLIGGIISTLRRNEYSGVPLLSKIPVIGYLFRTTTEVLEKTELFLMLTPHVIATPEEGKALTEKFKKRLDWLEEQLRRLPPLDGGRAKTGG